MFIKKNKLIVKTKSKTYQIYFGNNILGNLERLIKKNLPEVRKICLVSDNKLPKKILKKIIRNLKKYDLQVHKLSANEKTKSFKVANKIIDQLLKNNFNRSDCVIALGGGVIGDLSAFISSLTKRGLKFINIPTTLLSQVDASIGGKTGVNTNQGKNLIGTFYQPDFVISDISTLKSLPQREFISGYAEILKHSLIVDKKFFFWLLKNGKKIIKGNNLLLLKAIIKSCKIKSKIINLDEKEQSLRMILNFGHTFAHAFERVKNFSKNLNHGEAVLLGMMVANLLSNKKNLLPSRELKIIENHYKDLGLVSNISKVFKKTAVNKIIHFMKKDKKNTDEKINLILLIKIGNLCKPKTMYLKSDKIKSFLQTLYT
jgi:3-dehydroquinate synthase